VQRLNASDAGFADAFDALVNGRREADADVSSVVTQTIRDVRARGDVTLAEMTQRFDGFDLNAAGWQIDAAQCKAAYEALAPDLRDALTLAAKRIEAYHKAQLPENRDYRDADNVRLGARWSAVDAAGVYVPGGRAAYPSSVLMNAIPAKVAGVERIVMVTPTPGGETNQAVMAAAYLMARSVFAPLMSLPAPEMHGSPKPSVSYMASLALIWLLAHPKYWWLQTRRMILNGSPRTC
jgi:histidinol dehydrogenase